MNTTAPDTLTKTITATDAGGASTPDTARGGDCLHPIWDEPGGLMCTLAAGHGPGHVYSDSTGSAVNDRSLRRRPRLTTRSTSERELHDYDQ